MVSLMNTVTLSILTTVTNLRLSAMLDVEHFQAVTGAGLGISEQIKSCSRFQELEAASKEIVGAGFQATSVVSVPSSTHLVFYVHGGGFVSGSSKASAKYLLQLFLELEHRGLLCDILSVDYDLSPGAAYPTALRQVVNAYRYAAAQGKDIVIMGDSAGGNLCLGLLQHLKMPNPLLEASAEKVKNHQVLAMCLLSPWVNLRTEGPSVSDFKHVDCLDKGVLDDWAKHYIGPRNALDCYSNPIERGKHWGSILPKKSLIVAGGMELFLSDIQELARKIWTDRNDALQLIVMPKKGHAWAAIDYGFQCGARPLGVTDSDSEADLEGLAGLRLQADWVARALTA